MKLHKILCGVALFLPLFLGCNEAIWGQTKKEVLTNAKIIDLVKIGLGESLIVEKIRQSECQCDTSTDALAKLKAAKVSDAVIMAMLNSSQTEKSTDSPKNSQKSETPANSTDLIAMAGIPIKDVIIVDGSNRLKLMKSQPDIKVGGIGGMVPVFGKTRVKHNLKGSKSAVRVKTTTPEIEVFIASNLNPSDQIILVKFTTKSEAREIVTSQASVFGSKFRFYQRSLDCHNL